jgi:hypothetical protein
MVARLTIKAATNLAPVNVVMVCLNFFVDCYFSFIVIKRESTPFRERSLVRSSKAN